MCLPESDAAIAARNAHALVAGHALLDAGEKAAGAAVGPDAMPKFRRSLPARDYPSVAATIEHALARPAVEAFDHAVRILLAGFATDTARSSD